MGTNFGDCPSPPPRFPVLTHNQESYDTQYDMLMQSYGKFSALFFNLGRMSITNAPNLTITEISIQQIQNM